MTKNLLSFYNNMDSKLIYFIIVLIVSLLLSVLLAKLFKDEYFDETTTDTPKPPLKPLPNIEVVLYYAMWCGYSRQFLPEWEKFEKYASELPNVKISRIRCESDNENMCQQKGIEGYPTVVLYKNNQEHVYNGNRKADDLLNFVKKLAN